MQGAVVSSRGGRDEEQRESDGGGAEGIGEKGGEKN